MPRTRRPAARPAEPCDCVDCRTEFFPPDALAGTAVARQQPPPRCLVVYAPACLAVGAAGEELDLPHVAAAIQAGCSGLLAVRPEAEGAAVDQSTVLRNLLCQVPVERQPEAKGAEERGTALRRMRAEFAAGSSELQAPAKEAGFAAFHEIGQLLSSAGDNGLPDAAASELASFVASRLGLPEAAPSAAAAAQLAAAGEGSADLLFIQLDAPPASAAAEAVELAAACGGQDAVLAPADSQQLAAIDRLLQALNARPGFHDTVLLVLLLGLTDPSGSSLPQLGSPEPAALQGVSGYAGVSLPRQSCQFAGLDAVTPDRRHALLSVQRLPYVIRRDDCAGLPRHLQSFRPGNGCMLAERLLPELAYKLGKAPKYGA